MLLVQWPQGIEVGPIPLKLSLSCSLRNINMSSINMTTKAFNELQ